MEQTFVCFPPQSENSKTAGNKGGKEKKLKEKLASKRPHNQYTIYIYSVG